MGAGYDQNDFVQIDLSIHNDQLDLNSGMKGLEYYVNSFKQIQGAIWAIGGYAEQRNLYQSSQHFSQGVIRDYHLAIDIWGDAHSLVYLPVDGEIHSFAYNDQVLDYGYTLIIKHAIDDLILYSLYGHLDDYFFSDWEVGQYLRAGEAIARFGDYDQNGGWPPHLHFQLIKDIGDWQGDYPGVCSHDDLDQYLNNCPDPSKWIKM